MIIVAVSFKRLWKMLVDKDIAKSELIEKCGLTTMDIQALERDDNVSWNLLFNLATFLDCDIRDIMETANKSRKPCKAYVKPFLKWGVGQKKLLDAVVDFFPQKFRLGRVETFVMPNVGGGDVLFYILQNYKLKNIYIGDNDKNLLNCYICIKQDVESVINRLEVLSKGYSDSNNKQEYFNNVRARYNKTDLSSVCDFDKCSEFIFLNRTCYNGLYHLNKHKKFVVAHGMYIDPFIYDSEHLRMCSKLLQKVEIMRDGYEELVTRAFKNDFVYFDVCEDIIKTSSFQDSEVLGCLDGRRRLSKVLEKLNNRECRFLLLLPKNDSFDEYDELFCGIDVYKADIQPKLDMVKNKTASFRVIVTNYKNREWFFD